MEIFAKIVDGFQPLTILAKSSILDVWLGSEYVSRVGYKYSKLHVKICISNNPGSK